MIGESLFGRSMYAMKVGEGDPVGIVQCAMHGREFLTAKLALIQFEIGVKRGSCWFVPLVNPDGALLSEKGLASVQDRVWEKRLVRINKGEDFSLWKANARGVDLNVNFPARWGRGENNVRFAGTENYIGPHPFSEKETLALKRFTEQISPDYTVSYHTKGEEIYWYFHQSMHTCHRDKALAEKISATTGYPIKTTMGSVGGYKDWCISRFKIPSFTIEVGEDKFQHPLGEAALGSVVEKNKYVIYEWSEAVYRQTRKK